MVNRIVFFTGVVTVIILQHKDKSESSLMLALGILTVENFMFCG